MAKFSERRNETGSSDLGLAVVSRVDLKLIGELHTLKGLWQLLRTIEAAQDFSRAIDKHIPMTARSSGSCCHECPAQLNLDGHHDWEDGVTEGGLRRTLTLKRCFWPALTALVSHSRNLPAHSGIGSFDVSV
jgi:hypothetical protein